MQHQVDSYLTWLKALVTHIYICIYIYAIWRCCRTFSQWERSFHRKLCCHWLKGYVIQTTSWIIIVRLMSFGLFGNWLVIMLKQWGVCTWLCGRRANVKPKREWVIKFLGHQVPCSPYKSCNHVIYIGIITFPHKDGAQFTGQNQIKKQE